MVLTMERTKLSGLFQGKPAEWMDAAGKELTLWSAVVERAGLWVEGSVPLRTSMERMLGDWVNYCMFFYRKENTQHNNLRRKWIDNSAISSINSDQSWACNDLMLHLYPCEKNLFIPQLSSIFRSNSKPYDSSDLTNNQRLVAMQYRVPQCILMDMVCVSSFLYLPLSSKLYINVSGPCQSHAISRISFHLLFCLILFSWIWPFIVYQTIRTNKSENQFLFDLNLPALTIESIVIIYFSFLKMSVWCCDGNCVFFLSKIYLCNFIFRVWPLLLKLKTWYLLRYYKPFY